MTNFKFTRAVRNADNVLVKCRMKDDVFQVKPMLGGKFEAANINDYRLIQTKTIMCMHVDHSMGGKKHFRAGERYQIEQGRVLGGVAGYVFDKDGSRWTLFREEVGFSAADTYLFQAKYS